MARWPLSGPHSPGWAGAGRGLGQVRGGARRRQEVCPQRRPVPRSRETLTCDPGECRGGRGKGRAEAAHLAGQVRPARVRGGAGRCSPGWVTLEAAPGRRRGAGPAPRAPTSTSGVRGARPERLERARGWAGLGRAGREAWGARTRAPCVQQRSEVAGHGAGGRRGGARPDGSACPAAWTRAAPACRGRVAGAAPRGCTVPSARAELS